MDKIVESQIKTGLISLCAFCLVLATNYSYALHASNLTSNLSCQIQEKKVTVNLKDKSVDEILVAICKQADLSYAFDKGVEVDTQKKYSLQVSNVSVKDAIEKLLSATNYGYKLGNTRIIITAKPLKPVRKSKEVELKGIVYGSNDLPIAGATLLIKGTPIGTITNDRGEYSLKALPAHAVIQVSFVGMKSEQVIYQGEDIINIKLSEDIMAVDEVIVTGIFNKTRESYTGAVSSISKDQLQAYKGQNLLQTLRNIDPAFNILENNALGSDPNSLPDIQIRGNSSLNTNLQEFNEGTASKVNMPLIIMDGFEISLEKLMDYNDEEIESINLLKDASATAIYGSRGANGVVVVVTKTPKLGKLKVSFKAGLSLEVPDLTSYNMMNASEKLHLEYLEGFYDSKNPMTDIAYKELYYSRLKTIEEGTDTYWLSQPLRVGIGQNYNLRFEGGREEFRWSASVAYKDTKGAMKGSERKNFNAGITLSYLYKNFTFKNHTEFGLNNSNESPYGSFDQYVNEQPYYPIRDKEGNLVRYFGTFYSPDNKTNQNPLYNAMLNNTNKSGYNEIVNNLSIEWNILPELILRGQLGVSLKNNTSDYYLSPEHSSFNNETSILRKGRYDYTSGKANSYDASLTLSYSKVFAEKHSVYAGLNMSSSQSRSESYSFSAVGFSRDEAYLGNAINYSTGSRPSAAESTSRRIGATANMNYTFDNRYYADFSIRVDGSSQFGSGNRFAPFWSMGLGWNIHNEDFLKNTNLINTLRLRLSYGETGSQNFDPYQALSMFKYYTDDVYGERTGAYLMGLGNDNLKWQKTDSYNGGVDFTILNSRINGSFDLYVKYTDNLLSSMDLPYSTGFSSYIDNVGKVKNSGFEASLSGYVFRNSNKRISLMLSAKLSYNKNKIVKLSEDLKRQTNSYLQQNVEVSTLYYEGYPQNSIYAMRSLGIDPTTGQEIFLDKNGNPTETWAASDKVYLGSSIPLYNGNMGILFSYKNLSLNLSFGYHWGGKQYNSTLVNKVELQKLAIMNTNVDKRVLDDRWHTMGDNTFYKGLSATATRATSRFVMDDNSLSLQSASVQYRFQPNFFKNSGVESLMVSVNMSDLFYVSSIKRERGTTYPYARTMGANISLLF